MAKKPSLAARTAAQNNLRKQEFNSKYSCVTVLVAYIDLWATALGYRSSRGNLPRADHAAVIIIYSVVKQDHRRGRVSETRLVVIYFQDQLAWRFKAARCRILLLV